jgi:hypothetical protein
MTLRLIKTNFDFIRDKGYKRRVYSNGTDCEVCYTKQNNKILVGYQLSVPLDFISTDVYELLKCSFYSIDVIIKLNEKAENMWESSLFSNEEICDLKRLILNSKGMIEKQIEIYAGFLKRKIDFL